VKFLAFILAFLTPTSLQMEYRWIDPREVLWTEADCAREKRARDLEHGFTVDDPHFQVKHHRWYRRLSECGF